MNLYKTLFFLFFVSFSFSQENNKKLFVTIAPLSLIDINDGSSVRLGLEKQVFNRLFAHVETGFYLGNLKLYKINPRGHIFKAGIDYSIKYEKYGDEEKYNYVGFEYQYKDQDFEFVDSLEINSVRFEKQYPINRKMNCFSIKYGTKIVSAKLFFDLYVGLGIRYMNSSSNLTEEEVNGLIRDDGSGYNQIDSFNASTGKFTTPNFILGFKFGYSFF